jgi:biopolymer transport protein ExbD
VAAPQNENVLIRADMEVSYADFMAVVNQLQADGFYKVALINEAAA